MILYSKAFVKQKCVYVRVCVKIHGGNESKKSLEDEQLSWEANIRVVGFYYTYFTMLSLTPPLFAPETQARQSRW